MSCYLVTIITTDISDDGEYGYNIFDKVEVRNISFASLDEVNQFRRIKGFIFEVEAVTCNYEKIEQNGLSTRVINLYVSEIKSNEQLDQSHLIEFDEQSW